MALVVDLIANVAEQRGETPAREAGRGVAGPPSILRTVLGGREK